jgi:hypothetical protein
MFKLRHIIIFKVSLRSLRWRTESSNARELAALTVLIIYIPVETVTLNNLWRIMCVPNFAIKFVRHFCCDDEHGAGNKIERSHAKVVRKSSREDLRWTWHPNPSINRIWSALTRASRR